MCSYLSLCSETAPPLLDPLAALSWAHSGLSKSYRLIPSSSGSAVLWRQLHKRKWLSFWKSLQKIGLSTQSTCHHFLGSWPAMQTPCRYMRREHQHVTHSAQALAKLDQFKARDWPVHYQTQGDQPCLSLGYRWSIGLDLQGLKQ